MKVDDPLQTMQGDDVVKADSDDQTAQKDDVSLSSGNSNSQSSDSTSTGKSSGRSTADAFDEYFGKDGSARSLGKAKIVVLFFLLSLSVVTGWLWWKFATAYEENMYRLEFHKYADAAVQKFLDRVEFRVTAAVSFANALSTQAVGANMAWPFVSFSHFERRAMSPRRLTSATSIWLSPLVNPADRSAWESYAVEHTHALRNNFTDPFVVTADNNESDVYHIADWPVQEGMYRFVDFKAVSQQNGTDGMLSPIWQASPSKITSDASGSTIAMFNQPSEEFRSQALKDMQLRAATMFSKSQLVGTSDSLVNSYPDGPHVFLYSPIFRDLADDNTPIVGSLTFDIGWETFWAHSVDGTAGPLNIILENTCGQSYTFQLDGGVAATKFVAEGTNIFHNAYGLSAASTFEDFVDRLDLGADEPSACHYRIKVYPTQDFENQYMTNSPLLSGIGIDAIFVVTAAVFVGYDHFIQIRQKKILDGAKRSTAIIKSLFPTGIRNRLLDEANKTSHRFEKMLPEDYAMMETPKLRLQNFLAPVAPKPSKGSRKTNVSGIIGSEPIAEFFPATTIMYADLSGFTAWSSTREPAQVFTLLETIYGAMDKAARRLEVFKLETIGDCYVAATGMPDPRPDHATVMAKFANTCLAQIKDLTGALESQLGPGTGDLAFRIGMHSGPVTGGVLRGEKSRFQLFGDTMSTASKMESSGRAGRAHLSKETADLLIVDGNQHWIEEAGDVVATTGRGEVATFWLKTNRKKVNKVSISPNLKTSVDKDPSSRREEAGDNLIATLGNVTGNGRTSALMGDNTMRRSKGTWEMDEEAHNKIGRLVDYNAEVLISLLKKIVARRSVVQNVSKTIEQSTKGSIALDEIKEVVQMPDYNEEAAVKMASDYTIGLPEAVRMELREYISRIAEMYHRNSFHNFEHASHVALSASKLLKRIVMPEGVDYRRNSTEKVIEKVLAVAKDLHEHTLGISSDPVAQFAVVFSALIHDVDHPGVPNDILAKEEPETAKKYRNKSIAEQRSIDIAWDILLEDNFKNLRSCMFPSASELKHFRELIVNCVMATDIFDKELGALRKARWQKCFHPEESPFLEEDKTDAFNRKATIVLEHIIQASDVAHTMQHWHVYQKWNERLFREMYMAYKEGRSDKDPTEGWYKGELWFFDNYVIPLAHKLKECGVFGVSSDEYLIYAKENRSEWERKGLEVCKRMIADFEDTQADDAE